jgi:hypothetical protein
VTYLVVRHGEAPVVINAEVWDYKADASRRLQELDTDGEVAQLYRLELVNQTAAADKEDADEQ